MPAILGGALRRYPVAPSALVVVPFPHDPAVRSRRQPPAVLGRGRCRVRPRAHARPRALDFDHLDTTEAGCAAVVAHLLPQGDPSTEMPEGRVHSNYYWITEYGEFGGQPAGRP